MSKFGKELIESMQQAAKHAAGKKALGLRVSKVELPDVKAIRLALRMSQQRFAAAYRIPLPTLKNWEQGRRMPDAPAAAYLLAIKRRPKESWKPWRGHERPQTKVSGARDVGRRRVCRAISGGQFRRTGNRLVPTPAEV